MSKYFATKPNRPNASFIYELWSENVLRCAAFLTHRDILFALFGKWEVIICQNSHKSTSTRLNRVV